MQKSRRPRIVLNQERIGAETNWLWQTSIKTVHACDYMTRVNQSSSSALCSVYLVKGRLTQQGMVRVLTTQVLILP